MLTQRQSEILRLIIQNYTSSGIPVGSKTLMEDGVKASSATIRNDMKALEDAGLLLKTHSSSGRIPSALGYRHYVDHLLKPARVTNDDLQQIRLSLSKEFHEINEIIQQSAEILSELTSYTTFSLGPEIKDRRLTGFRIVPLNSRQVIAIVVTDKGNVESQVFTLPENLGSQDLEKIVRIVNERLVGDPLMTVYHKLRTEIPMILHRYFQTTEGISNLFDTILGHAFEDKIYVSGQMNLLDYELHQDLKQFKSMFSFMTDTYELTQMIVPTDSNIHIKIGSELGNELLQNMSMIQASYEIAGHGRGTIALLGPTSMPYSKMLGLVDVYRQELANKLADYYRSIDLTGS